VTDRILFLDIDGVLNSNAYLLDNAAKHKGLLIPGRDDDWAVSMIDPARVTRLNNIINRISARVVLSSSWRCGWELERIEGFLRDRDYAHTLEDATPRLYGQERHVEIKRWLEIYSQPLSCFAILDDDLDAGVGLARHFVHVADGLEDEHVETAVRILGGAQ